MARKIYLLSGGDRLKEMFTKEQEELLKADLKGKTTLVSIGAKREYEKNDIYFYGDDSMLGVEKCFAFSDLINFNLIDGRTSNEDGLKLLRKADIIYLQGGDPFVQLKYIKDNGYDDFLEHYDGILLGLSAGTMNLGKIAFYSKDEDYPETIFYDALGITDLTIDPHFDIDDREREYEIIEGSKKHRIIGLPDYSAIIIDEKGNTKNIGVNYIYENGKLKNS